MVDPDEEPHLANGRWISARRTLPLQCTSSSVNEMTTGWPTDTMNQGHHYRRRVPVNGVDLAESWRDSDATNSHHLCRQVQCSSCRLLQPLQDADKSHCRINAAAAASSAAHRRTSRERGPPRRTAFGTISSCSRKNVWIRTLLLVWITLAGSTWISPVSGDLDRALSSSIESDAYRPLREKEICPSLDIRNSAAALKELEGCRVVEGFVQIVLIEQSQQPEFNNHSYPMLREITGYLLLYRVFGLRSIGQLFPNLAVIRGQQLFLDFSLVVYELMQLQELGLKSLTDLQYGSVLIEKNPNLCYVDTIDWGRVGRPGRDHHFIQGNKKASECPKCPDRCPSGANGLRLCWSNDDCQKVCDDCGPGGGEACNLNHARDTSRHDSAKTCYRCHEECAGGCNGTLNTQCDVCKNVEHDGHCKSVCPSNFYLYMKRRCVTDIECITSPPPREESMKDVPRRWKAFNSECILDCPTGYQEEKREYNSTLSYMGCVPCKGPCPKVCDGNHVNNIETVQKLRGCTIIKGDLEIQIKGGDNIVQELERNLGDIEEIRGHLKIVRSFPLLSLTFLKNLKDIYGPSNIHSQDQYALVVQDNQNLQKLWAHNVTIHNKMSFHFNPRLCMNLIEELQNRSQPLGRPPVPHFSETDVSPWSNGDKATCNEQVLNVTVAKRGEQALLINWNNFKLSDALADKRQLLGYVISYIETEHKNVTTYDGRDACGGDGWRVDDVTASASDNQLHEVHLLTNLKPYTQYAIYVQTYTVAPQQTGKRVGARSPIIYERTLPSQPDHPEDLRAYANSSSELVIEWKPPANPNGVVTHYIVIGNWRRDDQEWVDKQDSCADHAVSVALPNEAKKPLDEIASAENRTENVFFGDPSRLGGGQGNASSGSDLVSGSVGAKGCCECVGPKSKVELKKKEKEQQFRIDLENALQNKVYVKQGTRNKRDVDTTTELADAGVGNGKPSGDLLPDEFPPDAANGSQGHVGDIFPSNNHTDTYHGNRLEKFRRLVTETSYTVQPVKHYAEYTIEVYACHDPIVHEGKTTKLCSKTAVTSARTKRLDYADDVHEVHIHGSNETSSSVRIGWNEPTDPNGLIVKYQLEYRRTDISNSKAKRECVRRKDYIDGNRTKVLVDLATGNYCVTVRAYSLAGPAARASNETCFIIQEQSGGMNGGTIAGILVVVFFIILSLGGWIGYRYLKSGEPDGVRMISINPDYHKYIPDEWEVARDNVVLIRELGQGSFGMVYEGLAHNVVPGKPEAKCAVKTVNEKATIHERIQFLNEASVMKEFDAHHVVKLLGVVSKGQPTLVIMELMAYGDLKSYLRCHRPDCEENVIEGRQPPTLKCILKMAIEIADGMSYLSEKKFVHRDLAARNCMVAEDLTVKIGDFGMTRDIYETDYYRKGGKGLLPVRWMAPESLRDGVFTSQCDVWSFGVVLWEMATLASQPYQGLSNEQVLKYVMDAGVMDKPEGCPDRLYTLMQMCWQYQARHRPTFIEIIEDLLPDVPPQFANVSFYHSEAGVSARAALKAQFEQESQMMNDPSTPLREQSDDMELESRHYGNSDQVLQIDQDDDLEKDSLHEPLGADGDDAEGDPDAASGIIVAHDDDDHVPVLYPHARQAYVLVRNPAGHAAANGNGSRSDSSKGNGGGGNSVPSEDSQGSYVSNGSARGNGYVMGILKQRRLENPPL